MRWSGVYVAIGLILGSALARGAEPFSGRISLTLESALYQQRDKASAATPQPITIDLVAHAGKWERAWAFAETFNRGEHRGNILEASVTPERIRIRVRLKIESDPWVPGGRAVYEIDLARQGERLEGSYTGVYRSAFQQHDVKGKAAGSLSGELPPAMPAGFAPPAPGEHPRLLFRKSDLPALRAKIGSGVPKAAFEHLKTLKDPVAFGVLYQLTGEASYAREAMPLVIKVMAERGNGYLNLGHEWGERVKTVAYAYDLCYDAWEPAFKEKVEIYLYWMTPRCLMRLHTLSKSANWEYGSNYSAKIRGGGAIATLALWGEKGPAPVQPRDPGEQPFAVAPPAGFAPGKGAPVNDWTGDGMPAKWLALAAIPDPLESKEIDYLQGLGGAAGAAGAIRENREITVEGASYAFKALDPGTYYNNSLEFMAAFGKKFETTGYFFTVIRVDRARTVRFTTGANGGSRQSVWLSGRRIYDQDYLTLAPGLHPLLVRARLSAIDPWGKAWMQPRCAEVEPQAMKADLAARAIEHVEAMKDWELDLAEHRASGGMDVRASYLFEIARMQMARYFRGVMGDDGFQGEGEVYTLYSCVVPLEYAHAYHAMFGGSASGRNDVSHFAPRYLLTTVFDTAKPFAMPFGYSHDETMHAGHYARSFAVVPEGWKPAVLWAWNRILNIAGEGEGTPRFEGDAESSILTLVNYPTGLAPKDPGEVMPRFWNGTTKGFFAFRNGWTGAEDIIAQIYARQAPNVGWSQDESGCFLIYGLGHAWNPKGQFVKRGSRWLDSVVMLPEDNTWLGGHGRVMFAEGDAKTGTGVVSINLDEVYEGVRKEAAGKDSKGKEILRDVRYDAGIRGMRSFAADYSGLSGAPGLFVVVDKITGGRTREWLFQLPPKDPGQVSFDGNTFTIVRKGATLKATFVTPGKVAFRIANDPKKMSNVARNEVAEEWKDVPISAIAATGPDHFFVVMTLQRGEAPAVRVEGQGLSARATVGQRVITFDGERIRLGR